MEKTLKQLDAELKQAYRKIRVIKHNLKSKKMETKNQENRKLTAKDFFNEWKEEVNKVKQRRKNENITFVEMVNELEVSRSKFVELAKSNRLLDESGLPTQKAIDDGLFGVGEEKSLLRDILFMPTLGSA